MKPAHGKEMHELVPSGSPVGVSIFSSLCRAAIATAQPSLTNSPHCRIACVLFDCTSICWRFGSEAEVKEE
jgi:hypothetical protein